jgi:hypothetical protein
MKNEMDVLHLDERQRLSWLLANRATLIVVGLVWLGMIAWEIAQHRTPWFLILMVPAFGLLRFGMYKVFVRRGWGVS